MMKAEELRIGNVIQSPYGNYPITEIGFKNGECYIRQKDFNCGYFLSICNPVPLTEDIVKNIRRIEDDERKPFEFRCVPPIQRQVENNYWSSWLNTNTCESRLHLSPLYRQKDPIPDFWFCWYHGNGEWFLPIQEIDQLKYVHQLQNLFFALTNKELEVKL